MIREKVAQILGSSNFMAVLTDGSQARKTGSDKEMVLIRTERNGNIYNNILNNILITFCKCVYPRISSKILSPICIHEKRITRNV